MPGTQAVTAESVCVPTAERLLRSPRLVALCVAGERASEVWDELSKCDRDSARGYITRRDGDTVHVHALQCKIALWHARLLM